MIVARCAYFCHATCICVYCYASHGLVTLGAVRILDIIARRQADWQRGALM